MVDIPSSDPDLKEKSAIAKSLCDKHSIPKALFTFLDFRSLSLPRVWPAA